MDIAALRESFSYGLFVEGVGDQPGQIVMILDEAFDGLAVTRRLTLRGQAGASLPRGRLLRLRFFGRIDGSASRGGLDREQLATAGDGEGLDDAGSCHWLRLHAGLKGGYASDAGRRSMGLMMSPTGLVTEDGRPERG